MQIEVTDVQMAACCAMVDAAGELRPHAVIGMGSELVRYGASCAGTGDYSRMKRAVRELLKPELDKFVPKEEELVINVGYAAHQRAVSLNFRAGEAVRYYLIDERGTIREDRPEV